VESNLDDSYTLKKNYELVPLNWMSFWYMDKEENRIRRYHPRMVLEGTWFTHS